MRQADEPPAVGRTDGVDAVDCPVVLVEAFHCDGAAVGGHLAATQVEVWVAGGAELLPMGAVRIDSRGPEWVSLVLVVVVGDEDLAGVWPPDGAGRGHVQRAV